MAHSHFKESGLIRDSQHCVAGLTNLIEFFEEVTKMINEGRCWMCLHGRLTQKIKMHGIHSDLIIWIQNWLTHRIQKVVVEGCYSG